MPVTKYIYNPLTEAYLMETDGDGNVTARYTQEPVKYGDIHAQHRIDPTTGVGKSYYYHPDALGSTRELTDESGTVVATYNYDAFGNTIASTGTVENPFRFTGNVGYYWDEELQTYHIRARNYQPTTGRWTSQDPIGFAGGNNLYGAYFVPFGIDPSGYDPFLNPGGMGGDMSRYFPPGYMPYPNILPPDPAPKACAISTHCYSVANVGTHCGFTMTTTIPMNEVPKGGPVWIDAGPGGAPVLGIDKIVVDIRPQGQGFGGGTRKNTKELGPMKEYPKSVCQCILDKSESFEKQSFGYHLTGPNSNYFLSCVAERCGVTIPPGAKQLGYDKPPCLKWVDIYGPGSAKTGCPTGRQCVDHFDCSSL